ncbi:SUMF1/EgtB/PvdO family nonheme iron enzyme [Aliivibrio sp. 1S165]|uniref:SUMF1/EgtB/PvdO family nonheme iron enzyme n=2 Tax=Aliivibrio TaxID=511678 RepID=UPI001146C0F8|nr:SUMF1/EgtB/PvdO family nonheme iron enzyme [Aliivibrio sp. 1S165]
MSNIKSRKIMNRKGLPALALLLSPALFTSVALANTDTQSTALAVDSVASIDAKLTNKRSEVKQLEGTVTNNQNQLRDLRNQNDALDKKADQLDDKRKLAQRNLDEQYNRMISDPDLDITPFQKQYQDSWKEVKENQAATLVIQQDIQEQTRVLKESSTKKQRSLDELEILGESRQEARVLRLQEELAAQDTLDVVHTITCKMSMTLEACASQGKTLSMQKAVNNFQQQLINGFTEMDTVKQHVDNVSLNIHVLDNAIIDSGFNGNNRYTTKLQASLRARPNSTAACQLLGLENRYCIEQSTNQASNDKIKKEKKWVGITIRSNRHGDNVTVNGVNYGNTPVDVMLPAGQHQVTVEKSGFEPYSRQMTLAKDMTVWAELKVQENSPKPGKKFADLLTNNQQAPQMVVIGSGNYHIGKNAKHDVNISKAYSIAATPVTVNQFNAFVASTGYITEAEKGAGCNAINGGETKRHQNQNWRKPGFEQSKNAPAVCISKTDAETYAHWLTKQTGFTYALPSESQWEVAARAGSKDAYWWGSDIGSGNANTGWGGSSWANKSTSPVGSFGANPYGIYDTAGNVWEWTSAKSGIVRGGAWNFAPTKAKVYESLELSPSTSANYTGFRVVRSL